MWSLTKTKSCFHNVGEVTNLLIKAGADVNLTNNAGHSPLHVAVIRDNDSPAHILITNGADVSIRCVFNL